MIKKICIMFLLLISAKSFCAELYEMKIGNDRLELTASLYGNELFVQDPTHNVHCSFRRKGQGVNNNTIPYDFIEYNCPRNVIISIVSYGSKRTNEFTMFVVPPANNPSKPEMITMWLKEYF